jgi:hypothetical protein
MIDRYTKLVLTVIAAALLYLCVVLTPWPAVHAQNTQRPGEPTGPVQAVIVGWRGAPGETIPVSTALPVPVAIRDTVQISGTVTTERSSGAADRVVLVGWEEGAIREKPSSRMRTITPATPGLPVSVK